MTTRNLILIKTIYVIYIFIFSIFKLKILQFLYFRPINVIIYYEKQKFILGKVSYLDAFSNYLL